MDEYTYDSAGNLLALTENKNGGTERTTTFTWNASSQMTGIDGPRTDAADTLAFIYYPNAASQGLNRGRLHRIVNGLNHTITFSRYNGFGKPEQAEDANNVITTYAYDARGRMTSRTTSGVTTGYAYDDAGRLTKITLPGNRKITYAYTDANLLEKITDNAGNSISYSCDDAGNRIREEIKDASEALAAYTDFTYDAFNHLNKIIYPGTGSPYDESDLYPRRGGKCENHFRGDAAPAVSGCYGLHAYGQPAHRDCSPHQILLHHGRHLQWNPAPAWIRWCPTAPDYRQPPQQCRP